MKYLLKILLLSLMFFSCKKAEDRKCWKPVGEIVTEERSLESFDKLELYDGIDYILIQDSLDFLKIEGGKNLINFIETEVEYGLLTIRDNNRCNFIRELPAKIEIEIHYTRVVQVYNESHGTISGAISMPSGFLQWDNWIGATDINLTLDIDSAEFALHTGAPHFTPSGEANNIWYYTSGFCFVDGTNLVAQNGQAHNAGVGDIRIRVENGWMACIVENYGNVFYTGDYGTIDFQDRGEGEIIPY